MNKQDEIININELLLCVPDLKNIIKIYQDPYSHDPHRLIEIEKIIDEYFPENNKNNDIVVTKIIDKYKTELKNFKYIENPNDSIMGKNIKFVSRTSHKLSNIFIVTDIIKNIDGLYVGLNISAKKAKTTKYISFIKNYIFEYIDTRKGNSNIHNLINNFIS